MNTYTGKTILLTGASGGIGAAMARHLKTQSTTLLLAARSEDSLEAAAAEVRAAGSAAHVYAHDLSAPGSAQNLYDRVSGDGHAVDVLVNNAGFGKVGPFETHDAATYARMTQLNVVTLTELATLFLPAMLERGTGGILNVASTAAYQPVPYMAVYTATKHYVLALSEALHAECKDRGVTVTALCPGPTKTDFGERAGMRDAFFAGGLTADEVARDGLDALLKGKRTVVSGALNRIGATLASALPSSVTSAIAGRLFAPGKGSS